MSPVKSHHIAFLAPDHSLLGQRLGRQPAAAEWLTGAPEDWLPAYLGEGSWRVLLSSHYLRFATLPWSRALESDEGRTSYMAARWRQLYGEAGGEWSLVLQAGHFEETSLLLAWPQRLAALLSASGSSDLVVQPLVTAAYAASAGRLPRNCLFATLEADILGLATVRGGQIRGLSTHRVSGDWRQAVSRIHQRLCLQDAALSALGPIQVLPVVGAGQHTAEAGEGWQLLPLPATTAADSLALVAGSMRPEHGFNLLPPRRNGQLADRVMLAVAAALLVLALGLRFGSKPPEAPAADTVTVSSSAPSLDVKTRQKLGREVAAVNRAVQSLNLPADAVISAVSPQTLKDVALLSIDITDASTGKARVVAGARSLAGMEAYLRQLEHRPDLTLVSLLHHETATSADWPYRFTVEAQWQAP